MVNIELTISESYGTGSPNLKYKIAIDLETGDEINIEEIRDQMRQIIFKWAESWLRLPNADIYIGVEDQT